MKYLEELKITFRPTVLYDIEMEMYSPQRAKNNINHNPDLKSILEKSWELRVRANLAFFYMNEQHKHSK